MDPSRLTGKISVAFGVAEKHVEGLRRGFRFREKDPAENRVVVNPDVDPLGPVDDHQADGEEQDDGRKDEGQDSNLLLPLLVPLPFLLVVAIRFPKDVVVGTVSANEVTVSFVLGHSQETY